MSDASSQVAKTITITLPYLPPASYSNNSRAHWTARRGGRDADNHSVSDDVILAVRGLEWHGEVLQKAVIQVTFGLPDRRRYDGDNLIARMKPVFDALCPLKQVGKFPNLRMTGGAGVIQDDALEVIGWPEYSHYYSPKQPSTTIRIEELLA